MFKYFVLLLSNILNKYLNIAMLPHFMEEKKQSIREHIMDRVLVGQDVDMGILEAYNQMPEEFRKSIAFADYYAVHRRIIEEERIRDEQEAIRQEEQEEILKQLETPQIETSKEDLCKACEKEAKAHNDKDFCIKCIEELQEQASEREAEIQKELLDDSKFTSLSSEKKAIVYVKDKYAEDKKKNKFLYLPRLAKETYAKKDM